MTKTAEGLFGMASTRRLSSSAPSTFLIAQSEAEGTLTDRPSASQQRRDKRRPKRGRHDRTTGGALKDSDGRGRPPWFVVWFCARRARSGRRPFYATTQN